MAEHKPQNKQIISAVNYPGDNCGCGYYRMNFPANALKTLLGGNTSFRFTETLDPILDVNWYKNLPNLRVIRIQRWFNQAHMQMVEKFLRPLCDALGLWLVYEIDDVLIYDMIPKFNIAREAFNPERVGDCPKRIMQLCDIVTVTTEEIKQLYVQQFQLDPDKVVVIPNYLPRWWIGESYNLDAKLAQWDRQHKKPRIGFACSTNHFDVNNANGGVDDFSELMPWIKDCVAKGKYEFAFVGGMPKQLEEEAKEGKVYMQPPSDLLNYPREMQTRNIDLLVAPLNDCFFNRCKSNIKWLECAALGIPMIGQNIITYNKYTNQVFNDSNDVENWIEKLFFASDARDRVADMLTSNRKIVDGENGSSGWWLEKNLAAYYRLYSLPQNTVKITYQKQEEQQQNVQQS